MKYLKIIVVFIFNFNLGAINIELQSSFNEIVKKKHVSFWIELGASESIVKNSLIFSFDNPNIVIKNYKISIEPEMLFIQSFKHNKKVYNCSFNLNLKLDFLKKELDPSSLFVMQVLIYDEQNKSNFAKILKIDLNTPLAQVLARNDNLKPFVKKTVFLQNKLFNFFTSKKEFYKNIEFKYGIKSLLSKMYSITKGIPILIFLILITFLFFWGSAKLFKRLDLFVARQAFIKEFILFILFVSFAMFAFYLKNIYLNYVLLFFAACCFLIVSCYYLTVSYKKSLIKLMLGISFGILVLPFFIKALLLSFL